MATFRIAHGEGDTVDIETAYDSFEQFIADKIKLGGSIGLIIVDDRLIPWEQVWYIDRLPAE